MEYIIAHTVLRFDLPALISLFIFAAVSLYCLSEMRRCRKVRKELRDKIERRGVDIDGISEKGFCPKAQ